MSTSVKNRNQCFLPHDLRNGSLEIIQAMGLRIAGGAGSYMYYAQLPEGWYHAKTDHESISEVYDDRTRRRMTIFTLDGVNSGIGRCHLQVHSRFYIQHVFSDEENGRITKFMVMDSNDPDKVPAYVPESDTVSESMEKCGLWLEDNHPDWLNPLAYWDD